MPNNPQHSRRRDYHGEPYPGVEHRYNNPQGWHLDKKVPLAFIFALIVQTIMIVIAFQDVKRDTALNTAAIAVSDKAIAKLTADGKDNLDLIRMQYQNLENKLDRLIERSTTK